MKPDLNKRWDRLSEPMRVLDQPIVERHGELGPVLVRKGDQFTHIPTNGTRKGSRKENP